MPIVIPSLLLENKLPSTPIIIWINDSSVLNYIYIYIIRIRYIGAGYVKLSTLEDSPQLHSTCGMHFYKQRES